MLHDTFPRAAVFLDRDGTLIEEVGYLDRLDRLALYPWAAEAIAALNRIGARVILVTNQSGIARGFFGEETVRQVHEAIAGRLARRGAHLDAYYYCPHHPDGKVPELARRCHCRKPGRGLVDRAIEEFGIDPTQSFTVGDRWLDVELANVIGGEGLLVRTGYGARDAEHPVAGVTAAAVVGNLAEAAGWIVHRLQTRRVAPGTSDGTDHR